jgi:quercetin dioxygenase-like cupin family protein
VSADASGTNDWDINGTGAAEWVPWGEGGRARTRMLASGDDYLGVLIEAEAGYVGTPHEHPCTEFGIVLEGEVRNQGRVMHAGGAYVARAGSQHTDFEVLTASRYLSIFKI